MSQRGGRVDARQGGTFKCCLTMGYWTFTTSICYIFKLAFICNVFVTDGLALPDYTIRGTNYGLVKGVVETSHGMKKVEKFFGIPYAKAPVGNLRLEAPVPPDAWAPDIHNAIELPPACPQQTEGVAYVEYHVPGFNKTSEDCLFLNIYLPRGKSYRSMPVLFFVHGGSYQNGMGAMFDGSVMATHGVVVVTFNYRLGPLGFITSADKNIPGNYGMLDMVAALKWVRENIESFHGDPNKVTIDGHSAGGCSVGLLLMSPLAKGLFHRVIQQSGSPLAHWAVSRYVTKPGVHYKLFTSAVDCYRNSTLEVKQCLQTLDSSAIEKVILDESEWSGSLTPRYRPVIDGHFLPDTPEQLLASGELNAVDFMTGATKDEGLVAAIPVIKMFGVNFTGIQKLLTLMSCFRGDLPEVPGIVDSVLEKYVKLYYNELGNEEIQWSFSEIVGDYFIIAPTHLLAERLSLRNVTVYVYNYEYKSQLDQWEGVIHGAELFYLSGCPFTGHRNFRYDHSDKAMARTMLQLWTNFIKHGVPSQEPRESNFIPRYTVKDRLFSRIHSDGNPLVTISSNLKSEKMSFWNEEIPALHRKQACREVDATSCSTTAYMTYTTGTNTWILISVCIGLSVLTVVLTVAYYKTRREVTKLLRQSSISSGERML